MNFQARAQVGSALAALFCPGEIDRLLDAFSTKRFAVLEGEAPLATRLLAPDDIAPLLANGTLHPPQIRISHSGNLVPTAMWISPDGLVDTVALERILDRGATLVIDDVGKLAPAVLRLEHAIERLFGCRTMVNAYLTYREGGAFALHYDYHDVLTIQVAGAKTWEVRGPVERASVSARKWKDSQRPPDEVLLQREFGPGAMLFLPRGTWHRAWVAEGENSLHLAVTITSPTGNDYLEWLVAQLAEDDFVWSDIVRTGGAEALAEHHARLQEKMRNAIGPEGFARFLEAEDWVRDPVRPVRLPGAVPPAGSDLLVSTLRRRITGDPDAQGVLEVGASGQVRRLHGAAARTLRLIDAQDDGIRVAALVKALSADWEAADVERAVDRLLTLGLIAVAQSA